MNFDLVIFLKIDWFLKTLWYEYIFSFLIARKDIEFMRYQNWRTILQADPATLRCCDELIRFRSTITVKSQHASTKMWARITFFFHQNEYLEGKCEREFSMFLLRRPRRHPCRSKCGYWYLNIGYFTVPRQPVVDENVLILSYFLQKFDEK